MPDQGAVVCACFSVGINSIRQAIEQRQLHTVDEIGAALRAGTNCGSCRPEIQALIDATRSAQA
jgi:assimilatory nitrate reductase catalytic subunit